MAFKRWAPCILALVPLVATAEPVDDVRAGTNIFLNNIKAEVDGDFAEASGYELSKEANTLDLDLSLASFGLADTQNIHATAQVSGNKITWTFNKHFSPPVAIDGSTDLQHAWGTVVATAATLSPQELATCWANHCDRNVRLQLAAGTHVYISGEGTLGFDFTEEVKVKRLEAMGGVPRPNLSAFVLPTAVYQKSTAQTVYPYLKLTSVAPNGGALLSLWDSAPGAAFTPPVTTFNQGQQDRTVALKLAPNFTGIFKVRAWSGGSMLERTFKVAPEGDTNKKKNPFDWKEWVPDILAGCIRCSGFIAHPADDVSIGMINGTPTLIEPKRLTDLNQLFDARLVAPTMMNASGWATGTLTRPYGTYAFVANLRDRASKPRLYQGITPVSVNAFGVLLANSAGAAPRAGSIVRGQFQPLALPFDVKESRATAMSNTGYVVGTALDGTGTYGFRFFEGRTTRIHNVGAGTNYTPVAVNDAGEVAAFVEQRNTRSPMRVSASGAAQSLGSISGYASAWPTAQNDLGWVVGTASNGLTTTGFLWTSTDGMLDLNRLSPSPRFVVREALAVTNDKQVVVRAVVNGRDDLYLLSF